MLALPGCHRSATSGGKTLAIGLDPEPLALASAGSIDAGASAVSVKLFDRLFNTDLRGEQVPMLAQGADVADEGRRVTIRLRPALLWHDGQPITSHDVAFSIREVWVHNTRARMAFDGLLGIDTPDAWTTVLHYRQPVPFLLSALADGGTQVVPSHLYEGRGDVRNNPVNLRPVGSGPWMFETWEKGNYLSLRRNPHYWDRRLPKLDRLVFRFISNGAPMVAALEAGSIDVAPVPLSDAARLKSNPALWVRALGPEVSTAFAGFAFNLNKPTFRDLRVRQAFAHAIDRDFILKTIYQGYGVLADSPIAPGSVWHASGLPTYDHNPARAEQLLDAAGFPRGKDGVRLRIFNEIMPSMMGPARTAQFIRQSLSAIGIELHLRQEGLPAYLQRIFTTRDWDTETYHTGSEVDPAIGIQRFYWSGAINIGVPYSNPTHYATPETDRLFDAAAAEPDRARRKQLYHRIQHIVQTDLPLIPLLFPSSVEAGSRHVDLPLTTRISNLAEAVATGG